MPQFPHSLEKQADSTHSQTIKPTLLSQPLTNSIVLHDATRQQWLYFHEPVAVLTTTDVTQVLPILEQVQQQVTTQQLYAAGFVSYEAAPAFDVALTVRSTGGATSNFPLIWFGLYAAPEVIVLPLADEPLASSVPITPAELIWTPTLSAAQYGDAIAQIKAAIYQGMTYQVNFSFRLEAECGIDPWLYFLNLHRAQAGCPPRSLYSAFVNLADWAICSISPELFFQLENSVLISRPMKGTAPRGTTLVIDRDQATALRQSAKNQAENLMIVDMVRNDMGRIAALGTVQVPHLFQLEQYATLWQMTSTVQCLLPSVASTGSTFPTHLPVHLPTLFQALFPCASITGAPKASTMQLIAELESTPRHIYTGTIGFLSPEQRAQFNVAIRTVLVDRVRARAEYGVGGGIVWDSDTAEEFAECCTKAKILTPKILAESSRSFELLETLLWTPTEDYFLLDLHLERLQNSAEYFGFPVNITEIRQRLHHLAATFVTPSIDPFGAPPVNPPVNPCMTAQKLRLRISAQGKVAIETTPLAPLPVSPLRVGLAKAPVNSQDPFLYHKTTNRSVYDGAKQAAPEWDEVLLWNERGELTEFCMGNLVVEWAGQWYTPPVYCGLLAGTFRARLLEQGKVQERVLRSADLAECSRIFLVNSVRQIQLVN